MDVPASLDRFVHATRLDSLTIHGRPRARSLRWWPLVALAALAAGYALYVAGSRSHWDWRVGLVGAALFCFAFGAAQVVPYFGPRLIPDADGALDEREMAVRARAGCIAGTIMTLSTTAGCFYLGLAPVFGRAWAPAGPAEWVFLGLSFIAAARLLPVLIASWLLPRPDEDDG